MIKQNFDDLQGETEKKARQREKKKKTKMKVSGAGVKKLQKIIKGK